MDINLDTDFTKLTDAELIQIKARWDPVSQVYLKTINELYHRQAIKEQKQEIREQENLKIQKETKRIAFWGLMLTFLIAILTVCALLL